MAVKKTTGKKAPTKKTPVKKAATGGKAKAAEGYVCGVCGFAVSVDEDCGCAEAHDIICCSEPMKKKRVSR